MVELTASLNTFKGKTTKFKTTNIKEIQAFQKYFKVVYLPTNLLRTIFDAARELREKVTDRILQLKIPGYAKDKYLYALHFGNIKFPHILTYSPCGRLH